MFAFWQHNRRQLPLGFPALGLPSAIPITKHPNLAPAVEKYKKIIISSKPLTPKATLLKRKTDSSSAEYQSKLRSLWKDNIALIHQNRGSEKALLTPLACFNSAPLHFSFTVDFYNHLQWF